MKLTKEIALDFVLKCTTESNRLNYPFRSRYRHTLRVLMWALRLQKVLGGDLEVLTYSAILHDCAWNGLENHAITSHNVAKDFLDQYDLEDSKKSKILEGVRHHNEYHTENLCKESYILMDADELDEVGALCILWDTLAQQHEVTETSYKDVLDRIKHYLPRMKEGVHKLNFDYSKEIYNRKVTFMELFVIETEEELENEL